MTLVIDLAPGRERKKEAAAGFLEELRSLDASRYSKDPPAPCSRRGGDPAGMRVVYDGAESEASDRTDMTDFYRRHPHVQRPVHVPPSNPPAPSMRLLRGDPGPSASAVGEVSGPASSGGFGDGGAPQEYSRKVDFS